MNWLCAAVIPVKAIGTYVVEPRFQPCVAEDISPRPISVSGAAFLCQLLAYFHRCSLSFAGVISRKRHDLRPGTRVTQ